MRVSPRPAATAEARVTPATAAWTLRGKREVGFALLAVALTIVVALLVLRLWRADLGVPFVYSGDATLYQTYVKGVLDHGWYEENPSLGAPTGQELYDYPAVNGENLNVVLIKVLGLFSSDSATVMNLFFLLTFPLVALTAFLVFRRLRISAPVAALCAALYALAPYHFLRGETHLFFSAYYAVPLGAYLVLAVFGGEPLFARREDRGRRLLAYATPATLATLAACLLLVGASGAFYYVWFTIILVAAGGLLRFALTRSRAELATAAAVVVALLGLSALMLAPTFVYRLAHGRDTQVAHRVSIESELYSLKLSQLVLPISGYRIGPIARAKDRYDTHSQTEARSASLGLVATLGFLSLLLVALANAAQARARPLGGRLFRSAALATVVAFLFSTIGGFSTLVGVVYPQFRAWNRMSIFIAFFSLLAAGLLLERLRLWLAGRGVRAGVFLALLAGVFLVAVFDQTSNRFVPAYGALAGAYHNDGDFVRGIEARLPPGSCVYQLPYVPFPESGPVFNLGDYDLAHAYLHSKRVRWSYGAIRGRPADWPAALAAQPLPSVLPALGAAGFGGIYLDRFGYADNGAAADTELRSITGAAPLVSANGRLEFFDLRAYAKRSGVTASPVRVPACGSR